MGGCTRWLRSVKWRLRFHSPVTYREPGFYPGIVTFVEYGLDLAALLYLSATWLRRRTS